MTCLEVFGGQKLYGELEVQGSKNAVLPILAACMLCEERVYIENFPRIEDVVNMTTLLENAGMYINSSEESMFLEFSNTKTYELDPKIAKSLRASVLLVAPILYRYQRVRFSFPGGCVIGKRPIDLHLYALQQMGVNFKEEGEWIYGETDGLKGATIIFPFPSVGATEQGILAAVCAKGESKIVNAAKEPEIISLCEFLNSMGAKIEGIGTEVLRIHGGRKLKKTTYFIPADRVVAATYLVAAAGCGGVVSLRGNCFQQLSSVTEPLKHCGVRFIMEEEKIHCISDGKRKGNIFLKTEVYPGFPTDMQSMIMAYLTKGEGNSTIKEEIFESRFACAKELEKMGAKIEIEGNLARIYGIKQLVGAKVCACDLRGGAALVIAGLMADGFTKIEGASYIARGYEKIDEKLSLLGAKIKKG